jgi:protein tyrosine kinase modulator
MRDDNDLLDDEPGLDFGNDFITEVWHRRKYLVFGVFTAIVFAALVIAASLPNVYRATAKVIVDRQELSQAFVEPSVTADLETRIQTIDQRVRSRENLSKLILGKNLYPALRRVAPIEAVVDRIRRDFSLQLEGVNDASGRSATTAFTITYRGRDPATVAEVANTLAALYVEENTRIRRQQAVATAQFLAHEVDRARQEMDAQDRRASEFTRRNADVLPQQLEVNMAALDRISTELRQNGEYQLRAIERRERLEKELADSALTGTATSEEAMAARLEKLRGDLADLRRNFSDKHPDVIRLSAEIAALQAQAGTAQARASDAKVTRSSVSRALADVDNQLKSLKEEEAKLRRVSASYEMRVENAPSHRTEVDRLSRGNDSSRERYETVLKRYDAARLATNLEVNKDLEQFRILDPAVPPASPAMPNRLWVVTMGFFAALVAAVAVVIAAEKLDTTFHSPSSLRGFVNIPVLATIGSVPTPALALRRRQRAAVAAGAAIIALILIGAASYYFAGGNEDMVRMLSRGGA